MMPEAEMNDEGKLDKLQVKLMVRFPLIFVSFLKLKNCFSMFFLERKKIIMMLGV